jgi:antitoxin component YwqK of YwqJK toxin-antitoxin module
MKKLIIIAITVFFITACTDEDKIQFVSDLQYSEKSKIILDKSNNQNANGRYIEIAKNAKKEYIKYEVYIKNGILDGNAIHYNKFGKETEKIKYIQNKEIYRKTTTYHQNNERKFEIEYANDKKNGMYRAFYPNGKKRLEIEYTDNKYDGVFKTYDISGILRIEATYKNDIQVGEETTYYKDGTTESITMYTDGKKNGKSMVYKKDGSLMIVKEYKNDKKNGKSASYQKGKKNFETIYKNGAITTNIDYDNDGDVYAMQQYNKSGKIVRNAYFDKQGEVTKIKEYNTTKNITNKKIEKRTKKYNKVPPPNVVNISI